MHCAGCVNAVDKLLEALEGVESAQVNLATESATVEYEGEIPIETFDEAVTKAGFKLVRQQSEETDGKARHFSVVGRCLLFIRHLKVRLLNGNGLMSCSYCKGPGLTGYDPGQVPHSGLLLFVSGLPVEKSVGSEAIFVTHQPVRS